MVCVNHTSWKRSAVTVFPIERQGTFKHQLNYWHTTPIAVASRDVQCKGAAAEANVTRLGKQSESNMPVLHK